MAIVGSSPKLVLATHNKGKLREFREMFSPLGLDLTSSGELGFPEPEETGQTFEENAILKAKFSTDLSGLSSLADDSGLCVTALSGAPGLYSARWAGPGKDYMAAMTRIHEALGNNKDRTAAFVCVLALVSPEGLIQTFSGKIEGTLIWPPRGTGGHGYDPFFMPEGSKLSFAEMTEIDKNKISHRGKALEQFFAWVRGNKKA